MLARPEPKWKCFQCDGLPLQILPVALLPALKALNRNEMKTEIKDLFSPPLDQFEEFVVQEKSAGPLRRNRVCSTDLA